MLITPTPKIKSCGVIVKMYEEQIPYGKAKYNQTRHAYTIDVKYDNGVYKTEEISTNIWYTKKVGSRICFETFDQDAIDKEFILDIILFVLFIVSFTLCINYSEN